MKTLVDVEEKPPFKYAFFLSVQHLFAMFGASVLIPTLFHMDPSIVLFMNGLGTLLYLIICKGKIPAFLGSSFAFIAPVLVILSKESGESGISLALGGFITVGLVFLLVSFIVRQFGTNWVEVLIPPSAMGPIVALIGLELAPVAAQMAGLTEQNHLHIIVSLFTLTVMIFGSIFFKGVLSTIPILIGIVSGYLLSALLGLVDYATLNQYSLVKLPTVIWPHFDLKSILIILPASLVVISEHIGHLFVTGNIVDRDLIKKPGLHLSLAGNGIGTILSGLVGSVPTTTYGENIGVMAITRVYSVWVMGGAAILSMILAFSGTLAGLIQGIPVPVMGGVSLLLFGVIAASGIRVMVESKINYDKPYNLIMTAIVFVVGISGISVQIGEIPLKGMGLATITALGMNITFLILKKLGLKWSY